MAAPAATTLMGIGTWPHAIGKMVGTIADDDSITQADLQVVGLVGFVGGMATQGMRANKRIEQARNGIEVQNFKYGII